MLKRIVVLFLSSFVAMVAFAYQKEARAMATEPLPAALQIPVCPTTFEFNQAPSDEKPKEDAEPITLEWEAAGITDGHPAERGALKGEEKDEGKVYTEIFRNLNKNERGSYLVCQYGQLSGMTLSRRLPPQVSTCTMVYDKVGDTNRYKIRTMACS